jgi:phage shock protein C
MAEKTRQHTGQQNLDSLMDFEDHELQATMNEFLEDEKKANNNIWNFATIAGIAMFFVAMISVIQLLGLGLGPDLTGLIDAMPLIGGILVTLVGFGFFVGDRKRKKNKTKSKSKSKSYDFDYDFTNSSSGRANTAGNEDYTLNNDLGSKSRNKSKGKSSSGSFDFDSYAFKQSKKLYKSRTDKKMSGVCGGLAKYFGISATVIRLLFVVTFLAGWGTSLLVYIGLAIALDKEPPEMMDDFDF